MSRKLSGKEMIFVSFFILGLVVAAYVSVVYFNYSIEQITKVLIPLGFFATIVERFFKRNNKINKSLQLTKNENKNDSCLLWAGIFGLFTILFWGFSLFFLDYWSKKGHEVSLYHLVFVFFVVPSIMFFLYLAKRSKINNG